MFIPRNVADVSKRDIRGFYSHLYRSSRPFLVITAATEGRCGHCRSISSCLCVMCEELLERRTADVQVRRVHLKRSVVYEIVLRRQKRKGVVRSCNIMQYVNWLLGLIVSNTIYMLYQHVTRFYQNYKRKSYRHHRILLYAACIKDISNKSILLL